MTKRCRPPEAANSNQEKGSFLTFNSWPFFLLGIGLSVVSLTSSSPAAAIEVDPGLARLQERMALEGEAEAAASELPDGMVSMFVDGDVDEAFVRGLGGGVGASGGAYRTVRIPAAALQRFLASHGLRKAQLAQKVEPQTINSVPATGATTFWSVSQNGVFSGSTGSGIIVGIVDTGIDFRHKDFKKANGTTRILNIWDQTKTGVPPATFLYGAEWNATMIDAGLCTQIDGTGHGTFIAGVAAGNGRGTIPGIPAYRYVGMAPEADIIVVNAILYDTYLADGVKYVFQRAQALGKPAVCLIAAGRRTGPHDGTDPTEITISDLVRTYGPNRLVVNSMGNYAASAFHAKATPRAGVPGVVTFTTPNVNQTGDLNLNMEGWYESANQFSVSIRTPSGTVVGPVAFNGYLDVETSDAGFLISNGQARNVQGDRKVLIIVRKSETSLRLNPGTYTITTTAVSGTGDVHYWMGDYTLSSGVPAFVTGVDQNCTAITPATADSVVSVGAYTFRNSWVSASGQTYLLTGNPVVGDIAPWSGRGYRRDNLVIPDITGPGQAIGSTRSAWGSVNGTLILPDSVHMIRNGTSIAAAHVAGALALELQVHKAASKNLSAKMAKQLLATRALRDAFTGTVPNPIWGNGKLKLTSSGAVGVEDGFGASFEFSAPFPNPSVHSTSFQFSLRTEDLADAGRHLELRLVDVRGRLVRTIPGTATLGPQRITWDGRDESGARAPAGVYFANLIVGDRSESRKFVRIDP